VNDGWKSLALWLSREVAFLHMANMARKGTTQRDLDRSKTMCSVARAAIEEGQWPAAYDAPIVLDRLIGALEGKE